MADLWGEGLGSDLDQLILELGEALDQKKRELSAKERWLDGEGPQTNFDGVAIGPPRPIDGVGSSSNPENEDWGASGQQLLRLGDADFGDEGALGGQDRPNPRVISNTVNQQTEDTPSEVCASDMLWAWGQFIDHDLDLTEAGHGEFAPIFVPVGDPAFPPGSMIPFTRVEPLEGTGENSPREYPNEITAYIDASMVYGSDEATAASLRVDGGKLLLDDEGLLVVEGVNPMAGDVRAGENIGLTSLHTLFAREHNWWVDQLSARDDDESLSDDELYWAARQRVEAEIQAITYKEFLPLLLGENAIPEYAGYDDRVNPGISVEFSTAVYRLGHSMLSTTIERLNEDGSVIEGGNIGLRDAFFAPQEIPANGGIAPILRGLANGKSQNIDTLIVEDVRSFLFGQPGDGGLDLASLNIQRGRDLGVPDYNSLREAVGLERVTSFAEITSDAALAQKLEDLYGNVDNIDAWIGGLAEDSFEDSLLGELFTTVMIDQFVRTRDGDPFFSKASDLPQEELDALWSTKLSDVIERNGDVEVAPDNVFLMSNRTGGGIGNDVLEGGSERDLLIGKQGNDSLYGSDGDDQLEGGEDNDFLKGAKGNDTLRGDSGDDIIFAGDGDDSVAAGSGNDLVSAGDGNDLVFAGGGRDVVDGGDDNDTIDGGAGNDILEGSFGHDLLLGAEGSDLLIGAAGRDTLHGGAGNDALLGGFNDDKMSGGSGDDRLDGGTGNDGLLGDLGNDYLRGDFGNDLLGGGAGNDILSGGLGNDTAYGGAGEDIIDGELGNDLLVGDGENDLMNGGAGNDTLDGGEGDDTLNGNFSADTLKGGLGDDSLNGGTGADDLDGGAGNDSLIGDFGNDTLKGGEGDDFLEGGIGDDQLDGSSGKDSLLGNSGDDWLKGLEGDDDISGGSGRDFLSGGADNDSLQGDADDDFMMGEAGNDTLKGGSGDDELDGGFGNDVLFGNGGGDQFRFLSNFGHDIAKDFEFDDTAIILGRPGAKSLGAFDIEQTDAGAVVHVSAESSITFEGWSVDDLYTADIVVLA